MKFSNYMLAVTYFIAGLGLLSLTLIEPLEGAFIALSSGAVLLTLVFNIKGRSPLPHVLWGVLALVLLLLFGAQYVTGKEDLIVSSSRFLAVLLPLKLFDLKSRRDHVIVYGTVFFLILSAASSTVSPLFFLILSLYIVAAIFALVVFNIHKELFRQSLTVNEVPAGLFDLTFFTTIIVVAFISILSTFILFFIMPRVGVGLFNVKTLNTVKVSGFSETVSLGSIGSVKLDNTVVMRVELPAGTAPVPGAGPVYLRGTALDTYDGASWSRSNGGTEPLKKTTATAFSLDGQAGFPDKRGLVEHRVLLEPLATEVLFTLPGTRYVEGGFTRLWKDSSGAVYLSSPPYSRLEYTVWAPPVSRNLRPAEWPSARNAAYLRTPYTAHAGAEGQRVRELVGRITEGLGTDREKAAAIDKYLKANYAYTLDPARRPNTTPLEDFLFYSREGFCEHFATAMVVMLREAGIPARLVTGFLQGEYNGFGNYFIVRQSDAHSWVEARLDGAAFTRLDPTPPDGILPLGEPSAVMLYADYLKLKWNRYVINYSLADQHGAAVAVESRTRGIIRTLRGDFLKTLVGKRPSMESVFYVAGALLLLTAFLLHRATVRQSQEPWRRLPAFYREMLALLSSRGFDRAESETPLEFARRVGSPPVEEVTEAFLKERYGGVELSPEEADAVKLRLDELKGEEEDKA